MAEEFTMYTAKVQDLGDTISEQAQAYLNKIEETTTLINNLASIWGGPTYDTFKASYDANLANLEELNTVLKQMAANVGDAAGEQMINDINSKME